MSITRHPASGQHSEKPRAAKTREVILREDHGFVSGKFPQERAGRFGRLASSLEFLVYIYRFGRAAITDSRCRASKLRILAENLSSSNIAAKRGDIAMSRLFHDDSFIDSIHRGLGYTANAKAVRSQRV